MLWINLLCRKVQPASLSTRTHNRPLTPQFMLPKCSGLWGRRGPSRASQVGDLEHQTRQILLLRPGVVGRERDPLHRYEGGSYSRIAENNQKGTVDRGNCINNICVGDNLSVTEFAGEKGKGVDGDSGGRYRRCGGRAVTACRKRRRHPDVPSQASNR